ncbi:EboA domain-containing protein [Streptomyces sp. NPDC054887]
MAQVPPNGQHVPPAGQHALPTRQHTPPSGSLPVWELRFAEAGRQCRPAPSGPSGPEHRAGPDDAEDLAAAARVLLLHAVRAGHGTAGRLYAHGTAAERRAVLLALPHLGTLTPLGSALPLVEDALRTNDTRLVAAAVGPYAAEHLDQHAWRHAVLKCLFTGVPVDAVDRLSSRARADAELARMLRDYAAERTAAGRPVPDDLHRVLALTAHPDTTAPGSLTARPDTTARPEPTAAPTEES